MMNNLMNNNNSMLIINNLNNNDNLRAIKHPQGIANIITNLNNTNLLNNLNSVILKNKNSVNKIKPNYNTNFNANSKLKITSEPVKNLNTIHIYKRDLDINQNLKLFISESNENPNEKFLEKNLFKEYKLKNTNDKKKLIVN